MRRTLSQILKEVDRLPPIKTKLPQKQSGLKKLRRRANEMEREVAKELQGKRVPMSGGGGLKGDVWVYSAKGNIFVECKIASYKDKQGNTIFNLFRYYLDKMRVQAQAMNFPFCVLVFRFLSNKSMWVIMPRDHYVRLGGDLNLETINFRGTDICVRVPQKDANRIRHAYFCTLFGAEYVITTFDDLKHLIGILYDSADKEKIEVVNDTGDRSSENKKKASTQKEIVYVEFPEPKQVQAADIEVHLEE